jgi:hypothetical protein
LSEQRRNELGNILAHLPQCRHAQFNDVKAVIEIMTELARLDTFTQLLMGRTDQAHVDRIFLSRSDLAHLLLLDRAQQLDLHGQRQVGDLVEEQRAAMRRLKETIAIAVGTGEGALCDSRRTRTPSDFPELPRN